MSLSLYRKKRDFKHTPEPEGKKIKKKPSLSYVIQKHAASHLHYDFRLELNGVLKSWAVPKGPSLDPSIKRLAVHVEDHPIEYGSFEGIIPAGHYGAGTVMVWDSGKWQSEDKDINTAYRKGNLTFTLAGKKLKGRWKLVQIKNDPKNWLLLKINDKYANPSNDQDILKEKPLSAKTNRTLEEITFKKKSHQHKKSNKKRVFKLPLLAKKRAMPDFITPQLSTLVNTISDSNKLLHEIKFDGYRLICFIKDKTITLMTRNHQNWTSRFKNLVAAISQLNIDNAILDGEVVVLDENQQPNFQLLQNAINEKQTENMIYYAFDLIYYDGYDLSAVPLIERKELLRKLLPSHSFLIRYSDHVVGNGNAIYKKACELGLEGIISKEVNSPYIQKRTRQWLKLKCNKRQEFVVCGFTKPRGQRQYFGSLLLGVYDKNHQLRYCGHVGTGFNDQSLENISKLLKKYETTDMPFKTKPPGIKYVTWTTPQLVVEVEFIEWTKDGILRHPSFKGIREDKPPKKIKREIPKKVSPKNKSQEILSYPLSNPNRIFYPEQKITKLDLAKYYDSIHEWILPYIINRPLTLVRCPNGYDQPCFYQKHMNEAKIEGLFPIPIKEKEKLEKYIYIKNKTGLFALAQLGVLEIHTWNCHLKNIEKPDLIIFDLDPAPDVEWKRVVKAAIYIRDLLDSFNLTSFVKTSGGKGLHVVVPIKPKADWKEVKLFSETIVKYISSLKPEEYISVMTKSKRTGKIFIDYHRNNRGSTTVAPYSTRAKNEAPVSTPLRWDELSVRTKSTTFTLENLGQRLSKLKRDPWEGFFDIQQTFLTKELKKFLK